MKDETGDPPLDNVTPSGKDTTQEAQAENSATLEGAKVPASIDSSELAGRKERLWAFAQSPLGIWVLSTVVVGILGTGFTYLQNWFTLRDAKARLVERADAEAISRLKQWVGMSQTREARRRFSGANGSNFPDFYFALVKPPVKQIKADFAIYPIYPEFADSSLISVFAQLRDNVPDGERAQINGAISWVGVWDRDFWKGKGFNDQVETVLKKLWLSGRAGWDGSPLLNPAPSLYHIRIGEDVVDQLEFLSAKGPAICRNGRICNTELFLFSADDGSGRQEWEIEKDTDGFDNIRIASGIEDSPDDKRPPDYLSTETHGQWVDLYDVDDGSGRQRWIIERAARDLYRIRIRGGVVPKELEYLTVSPNGEELFLAKKDDGAGRQEWKIECVHEPCTIPDNTQPVAQPVPATPTK